MTVSPDSLLPIPAITRGESVDGRYELGIAFGKAGKGRGPGNALTT